MARNFYWLGPARLLLLWEKWWWGRTSRNVKGVGESIKQTLVLGVDARKQGVSWGLLTPLRMPRLLPHDLCHGWSCSRWPPAFDCVDHNKLSRILKEMEIPEHLSCLLRNLYACQEATVTTGHGTTDWLQIRKGVCQAYIITLLI